MKVLVSWMRDFVDVTASPEDIAKTMECPVGTVRSRIFRAREAIDRSLREVFDGGLGRIGDLE